MSIEPTVHLADRLAQQYGIRVLNLPGLQRLELHRVAEAVADLATLGVVFTTCGRPMVEMKRKALLTIILAGVGLVVPVLAYLSWLRSDSFTKNIVRFEVGFWGTIIAFVASIFASSWDYLESR